jgi:hypothetical protein
VGMLGNRSLSSLHLQMAADSWETLCQVYTTDASSTETEMINVVFSL